MERRPLLAVAAEITLRLLALSLGSVPSLIAAVAAIGTVKDASLRLPGDYYYEENYYHEDSNGEISIDDVSEKNYRWVVQLRDNTYTATGVAIGAACLGIILQVMIMFIQLLIIRLDNLLMKIFFICDIIISFALAVGHNVGGVLLTSNSNDIRWSFFLLRNDVKFVNEDDPEKIRNAVSAGSAFCSNATFLFLILAVFLIFFLSKDWNKKKTVTSASQNGKLADSGRL